VKVLLVNTVLGYSSTGKICQEIYETVVGEGHEAVVAYGRGEPNPPHVKFGSDVETGFHLLETRLFDRHGQGSHFSTQRLVDLMKSFRPDIVHLHNLHGYYLNVEMLFEYLELSGVKTIVTLHDCWLMTGHCAFFSYVDCQKWATLCEHCPQVSSYPNSLFLDRSTKNHLLKKHIFGKIPSSQIVLVAPSQWLCDVVSQSFLSKFSTRVINNGIDLSIFQSKMSEKEDPLKSVTVEKKFVVLAVASVWENRKGLRFVRELASLLPSECLVVVVGRVSPKDRFTSPNVVFIERTSSRDELATLYRRADVFVNTTMDDNYPTTNLESLACGTPVVTFDTGGSPESVTESTGIVVKKGDVPELVQAVLRIRLLGKNHFSESCVSQAKERFGNQLSSKRYLDLYHQLLQERA